MGNRAGGVRYSGFHPVLPPSAFGNNPKSISVWGFDTIIKNLNREILKITKGSIDGVLDAVIYIRRDMDTKYPKIPVRDDILRQSWDQVPYNEGNNHGYMAGFSANYALWVHENMEAVHWTREGSGPKFFEAALNRNHDQILQIIADKCRLK